MFNSLQEGWGGPLLTLLISFLGLVLYYTQYLTDSRLPWIAEPIVYETDWVPLGIFFGSIAVFMGILIYKDRRHWYELSSNDVWAAFFLGAVVIISSVLPMIEGIGRIILTLIVAILVGLFAVASLTSIQSNKLIIEDVGAIIGHTFTVIFETLSTPVNLIIFVVQILGGILGLIVKGPWIFLSDIMFRLRENITSTFMSLRRLNSKANDWIEKMRQKFNDWIKGLELKILQNRAVGIVERYNVDSTRKSDLESKIRQIHDPQVLHELFRRISSFAWLI